MIFMGSFFCGDTLSVPCTPTNIDNINYIAIGNAVFDDLYVTGNVSSELTKDCPANWDFDTVLYAKFNDNTLAGNVDWSVDTVSNLLIKRRKMNEFKWITLQNVEIHGIDDFNFNFRDVTCAGFADYQYAAVPVMNGIEGNYSTADVRCESNQLTLIDRDEMWSTIFTDGFCNTASNVPISTIVTMYDKYPAIIRNSDSAYETVSVTAGFFPVSEKDNCTLAADDPYRIVTFSKAVKNFLINGKTKLLKNIDGRIWLGCITTPPSDTASEMYNNRQLSFELTEIGDVESEEELYDAGFITVGEEWWNR